MQANTTAECHCCGRNIDSDTSGARPGQQADVPAHAGLLCTTCKLTFEALPMELQSPTGATTQQQQQMHRLGSAEGLAPQNPPPSQYPPLQRAPSLGIAGKQPLKHKQSLLSKRLGSLEGLLQQPPKRLQRHVSSSQLLTPPNSPTANSHLRRRESLQRLGDLEPALKGAATTDQHGDSMITADAPAPSITRLGSLETFRHSRSNRWNRSSSSFGNMHSQSFPSLAGLDPLAAALQPHTAAMQLHPAYQQLHPASSHMLFSSLQQLPEGIPLSPATKAAPLQEAAESPPEVSGQRHNDTRMPDARSSPAVSSAFTATASNDQEPTARESRGEAASGDVSPSLEQAFANLGSLEALARSLAHREQSPRTQKQPPSAPQRCKAGEDVLEGDPAELMRMTGHLVSDQ